MPVTMVGGNANTSEWYFRGHNRVHRKLGHDQSKPQGGPECFE